MLVTPSPRHGCSTAQLIAILGGGPAIGAELFYMDHDPLSKEYVGPVGPLVLSDEIRPGDYDRLLAKIRGREQQVA